MDETSNTLETLLSPEELQEYSRTEYPFNISILYNALRLKLLEDPDYEVWVPLVYYKCLSYIRFANRPTVLRPRKVYISNLGRVCSLRTGKSKILTGSITGGYRYVALGISNGDYANGGNVFVHRAMGCCFIPVKDILGGAHPKDLQINHIDGIKLNITLSNLEWETPSGNIQHAVDTGLLEVRKGRKNALTKPVKGFVLAGKFAGHQFVLSGGDEIKHHGFIPGSINRCCKGVAAGHRGCSWLYATDNDIKTLPSQLSPDILNELPKIAKLSKMGILATNLETGVSFVIEGGGKEIRELGFTQTRIYQVIHGRAKHHKGHVFERVAGE